VWTVHVSLREADHWEDPDVDERIILRGIFRKWEGVVGNGWSNAYRRNLITGLTSAASPRVHIWNTCKVGQKLGVSLPLLTCSPFGVTIPATVPQGSEIPEGLMNNPVHAVPQGKYRIITEMRKQRDKCLRICHYFQSPQQNYKEKRVILRTVI
jgi:hypothetical protein